MEPIITVKNLGKKYDINHQRGGYIALRDVIANVFKNPFKFIFHKTKQIAGLEKKEEFWALKDVNFSVEQGEVIGIIGHNGAGKSTLLKILSQITPPTTGEIEINGTIGSLLEVGTGFHPELSGRENIMLNGAILGMGRKEIIKKFDQIVEFAGIEKFLDTPVKYYSSGMYVRLAFSVAAHMDTDILIIDEVLAVGDAEFQKKCLGKMEEVTQSKNRTILFVSHDLGAIQNICKKTMLLKNGKVEDIGETGYIIKKYLNEQGLSQITLEPNHHKDISFTKVWITDANDNITNLINLEDDFKIWTKFIVNKETDKAEISFILRNSNGINVIFTSVSESNDNKFVKLDAGEYIASSIFEGSLLLPDDYTVSVTAHERGYKRIDYLSDIIKLSIADTGNAAMSLYGPGGKKLACILSDNKWEIAKSNSND